MNLIKVWDRIWDSLRKRATTQGESGYLMTMADAKFHVVGVCGDASAEYPSSDDLEFLASDLVRLTLEASDQRESRLRPRSKHYEHVALPEVLLHCASGKRGYHVH